MNISLHSLPVTPIPGSPCKWRLGQRAFVGNVFKLGADPPHVQPACAPPSDDLAARMSRGFRALQSTAHAPRQSRGQPSAEFEERHDGPRRAQAGEVDVDEYERLGSEDSSDGSADEEDELAAQGDLTVVEAVRVGDASRSVGAASSSSVAPPVDAEVSPGGEESPTGDPGSTTPVAATQLSLHPRQARGHDWGPFKIAPIFSKGVHTGFGATCGKHHNEGDTPATRCKTHLVFGTANNRLSHDECRARVKLWCLRGRQIPETESMGRDWHLSLKPRFLDIDMTEAEMDRLVQSL